MQPTTMLPKLTDTTQTISFSEGDGVCSAEVYATGVVVTTNAGNHDHGSSKVKLKNLVDYNWEPKFYSGQLLAIHMSGKYLAYSIKAPNTLNPGTWTGMVRVVYDPETSSDRRALIKGLKGEVQDLSFAHINNQVILATIDELGNFYVHEIEVTDTGLRHTLLAEICDEAGVPSSGHRVVWCPYIPDDDDEAPDEDVAKLLLTTHGNIGRIWNMRAIIAAVAGTSCVGWGSELCGAGGGGGARQVAEHEAKLVEAAFSPDGTALATAAQDGYVMFFQVYMLADSVPRCLHRWQPHGGKPLSCLFFLDNHTGYNSEVQFWKFAVTGADNNTTIKVWSCKSWNCMQTIKFTPTLGGETLGLKAMLDRSASYLLLSDFKSRSLYVMNMARDSDDTVAYCKSISEFLLPYPVLSFCIIGAEEQQVKCESSCEDPFHRNGSAGDIAASPDEFDIHHDEEEGGVGSKGGRRVSVRLYIVQPKGLQEGRLLYTPCDQRTDLMHGVSELCLEDKCSSSGSSAAASNLLQQQSQQLKNLLLRAQPQASGLIVSRPESPPGAPQLNLMTPDAFSSPGKREEEDIPMITSPEATKPRNSTSDAMEESVAGAAGKMTSGGSSPSREVQEIMSHNDELYKDDIEEACEEAETVQSVGTVPNGAADYPADLYEQDNNIDDVFPPQPDVHSLSHTSSETNWPQISIAQITSANQRAASGDKSLTLPNTLPTTLPPALPITLPTALPTTLPTALPTTLPIVLPTTLPTALPTTLPTALPTTLPADLPITLPPTIPQMPAVTSTLERAPLVERATLSKEDKGKLDSLEMKLDKLTDLVERQALELRALRTSNNTRVIEDTVEAHAQRTVQLIENALSHGWDRIARLGETASNRAAQAAGIGAARALEPLAAALQHELAAKLTSTDNLLRDNIEKLANSKTVTERLSTSIAKSVSEVVRESFRSTLFDSVLPAMEKAHAQIFRQVNHAFQQGTKEFAANTEAMARAAAERGGAAATASLRAALDRHAEALAAACRTQAQHPTPQQLTSLIEQCAHSVLEKEMTWWREQARSVAVQMSRAHSPATPSVSAADRQMQVAQIQSLMAAGDVNGAFQLALSASDLALVMCACRAAEPGAVFGPPCQLRQHVLLSLVQQLAADMARDTHLKHRFLEEAVMNLDTSNPVTREHLPGVVRELQKQIMAFLNASPSHNLARQFRMLLMATEALVKGTA